MSRFSGILVHLLFVVFILQTSVVSAEAKNDDLIIKNQKVRFSVKVENSQISKETLSTQKNWGVENGTATSQFSFDGNFRLDIFWTYWNAPGKINNSDLQLYLTKNDFKITGYNITTGNDGSQKIIIDETSPKYNFTLKVEYLLGKNAFFVEKKITVFDSEYETHFLQKIHTFYSTVKGIKSVIKKGGYGQPAAFAIENGGGFAGVEYPTATTEINADENKISSVETIAKKITSAGVSGSQTVIGITPKPNVKFWFMKYLDFVRVAKLKPYTLYNSWYDLRSVEYPNVPPKYWMNEKNVFRIINEIKSNFVEKHGIKIDAFVLDDGWDIYQSDWKLRRKQFPHGMLPISEKLKEINSTLGLWFGPTGGYSFRLKRINWMKAHGYEVVGSHGEWQPMMCIAGKNYKKLFKKRVTDFVKNAKVGYYKWDGIQFSCSEPDHGHPVGEYSRRAVMESVADICNSVRKLNPDIFLNITSGTWLSPWWVKYANTIWMQGGDYGYSDVPSISSRDRAITYRDITLYNDFTKYDLWFPISNLMTHGIIKGELQKLGGESEPIDKFTDNAVLYFARGVAMYELYISPDILSDNEWNALAQSLKWGKTNFDILMNTEMIGGDPSKSESYGFTHFKGDNALIAVRNPKMGNDEISFVLSSDFGMNEKAKNLVMEEIYPRNIISDKLYKCGDKVSVSLDGFETAIFSFHPIDETDKPLISGVDFIPQKDGSFSAVPAGGKVISLPNGKIGRVKYSGKDLTIPELIEKIKTVKTSVKSSAAVQTASSNEFTIFPKLNGETEYGEIAILYTPDSVDSKAVLPEISVLTNGKKAEPKYESEKGKWKWSVVKIDKSVNLLSVSVSGAKGISGEISVYLITYEKPEGVKIEIANANGNSEIYPPRPLPNGLIKKENMIKRIKIKN